METQDTEFSCHAPDAEAVFLAGTFNDWKPWTIPLTRSDDGMWRTSVPLETGRHEFKFIVDGKWCCEPGCERKFHGCPKCCANEFGTMNRVVEVA